MELQLSHSVDIKARIDRAWGVSQSKSKKKDPPANHKDSSEADTYQDLHFIPLGQDIDRKRYWVVDGLYTFPRIPYLHVFAISFRVSGSSAVISFPNFVPRFSSHLYLYKPLENHRHIPKNLFNTR